MAILPEFGVHIERTNDEVRPAVTADMSTIGLVVTAPDADAAVYPLDVAVLINSVDEAAVDALGLTGSIANQVPLINANLEGRSALMVIVRVEEGADEAATMANLIAGLTVLRDCPAVLGVTPRLIAVPGYTHQQATPATANPVVAALSAPLATLKAHAVVSGPDTSLQAFTDWRETVSEGRIIPLAIGAKVGVGAVTVDAVGVALGRIVAVDAEHGGRPFHSAANRPAKGIVGASRPVAYAIGDGNVEAQLLLAQDGGVIVKGERGDATALTDGGFSFIAYATAHEDDLWRFYNQTRGRDYIELVATSTLAFYLGRRTVTMRTVDIVLDTLGGILRDLQAEGDILGYEVSFDVDKNSPEQLRTGRIKVGFRAEEPATLRLIEIESGRFREALTETFANIAA